MSLGWSAAPTVSQSFSHSAIVLVGWDFYDGDIQDRRTPLLLRTVCLLYSRTLISKTCFMLLFDFQQIKSTQTVFWIVREWMEWSRMPDVSHYKDKALRPCVRPV